MTTPVDDLLTIPEAARRLGVGRTTMYQLINAGHIRRTYITPRAVRIHPDEIHRYVEEQTAR